MTRFDRLPAGARIVGPDGQPLTAFTVYWQRFCEGLEKALSDLQGVNAAQSQILAELLQVQQQQQDTIDALVEVQAATQAANDAAAAATQAATVATETIEQIEAGTLDLSAVTVGGTRFVNNGGTLTPEP